MSPAFAIQYSIVSAGAIVGLDSSLWIVLLCAAITSGALTDQRYEHSRIHKGLYENCIK